MLNDGFPKNAQHDNHLEAGELSVAALLDLGVLRERALRRLLAAHWASTIGDVIVIIALPFAIFEIGGSATEVGIAFGARSASLVLLVLLGGAIGDRFERRVVMIGADLLRLATQGLLAVLLILGAATYWEILVLLALQGAGSAFFSPAMSGLLPQTVSQEQRQDANALSGLALSSATMLGAAFAGVLIATAGPSWAFALDAATFAASAVLLAGIKLPAPEEKPEAGPSLLGELVEGWSEFRRRTWLWVVVLEFGALNALVFGPFAVLGPIAAEQSLGGAGAWATILIGSGIGALAGGVVALRWRPARPLLVASAMVATWAAPLVLLAAAAPVALIAASAVLAGAGLALFDAIWQTTIQANVPASQLSRLSSYDWMGSLAMLPIGYLLAGVAEGAIGAGASLFAAAAIVLLATAAVVALPCVRGMRSGGPPRSSAPALSGSAALQ